ncbi:MAG: CDP-diacylglycerol--glycerol-3-phosphate 3-phosphatidyltransferase [Verrucomicrobia bacterium]|nr:MAG: CDP-diacylglycerol--glycerol-3-phosphate 3-phosphatidyltransferase [Verrucomicrobiota bacterium]TAE87469.1 MAG: CDP-diacylglycerol--glycerol-3-phosphate 3-phosphatidyltransferase [Verrucomicrobiota bacterium]TAF25752.1 MAG: CDP-diacylglycerol--glycerol-3-phosphate 3-phosphatidyltransferase [Verrucomicrobiota bacterium]TAF41539.1 MAG: CDP-diacylglycerol--glycerol-3-phosphate 3-phosphatidyltransferase [Verrucomicrobiota bacterium]
MNLPNAITLSRLVLTGVFVAAVGFPGNPGYAVALVAFTVAAATDWLDGHLARKLGLVTPLGKLLDPLADKILVCAAFVFFSAQAPGGYHCPVWVTALIIAREFLVTGLRQIAMEAGQVLAADGLGKWKTTFQLTYCIAGLVWLTFSAMPDPGFAGSKLRDLASPSAWLAPLSLWTAVALTLVSGANYVWNCRRLLAGRS